MQNAASITRCISSCDVQVSDISNAVGTNEVFGDDGGNDGEINGLHSVVDKSFFQATKIKWIKSACRIAPKGASQ